MAAGILPPPGTANGPCMTECRHRYCAEMRRDAAQVCVHCGELISYGVPFCRDGSAWSHAVCAERVAERARRLDEMIERCGTRSIIERSHGPAGRDYGMSVDD